MISGFQKEVPRYSVGCHFQQMVLRKREINMLKNNFRNGCISLSILQKLIVDGSHVRNGHLNEKILE